VAALLPQRDVYCLDSLGEPGLSVQAKKIRGAADQARWLDETLYGLNLPRVHLCGISLGGWAAVNHALRCPGRAASLTLLDPAVTFDRIPLSMVAASMPMVIPGAPRWVRRRVLGWISGGSDIDASAEVAGLIAAATTDFVMHVPAPRRFTDAELRAVRIPVLALLAGRSVVLRAGRAAEHARNLLQHSEVEVWREASHALSGEYPVEIAQRAGRFWDAVV
jgi:pimeloyl-ACP methyl ester carboxylesterase